MRILIVDPSIGRTGALLCAGAMATALNGKASCDLVSPVGGKIPAADLAPFQAVNHLALRNPGRSPCALLPWLWSLFLSSIQLRLLLSRRQINHLVLNDWYLPQGMICRLLGYRGRIFTWVRLDPWRFGRMPAAILFRLINASSDHIMVVSRHVQRRLPFGVQSTLLYDILPQPAEPAVTPRGHRLIYVGNYTPGKGQDLVIEAFARIASRHPEATLYFYGSTMGRSGNSRWRAELEARVEALNLADRIRFHGFAADPRQLLQGAFAAINCSEAESFSLTVLEASAAGLPVIATACGGPAEILVPGITGLLTPVGDVDGVADAIHQLLADPALAQQMGAAGAAHVRQRFDPAVYRQQLIRLFTSPHER